MSRPSASTPTCGAEPGLAPRHAGVRGRAYTLITPANHYPSRLPNVRDGIAVKLVTPRLAPARLGVYLISTQPGGALSVDGASRFESFVFGLDGEATIRGERWEAPLGAGAYAYVPVGHGFEVRGGAAPIRLLWFKRPYEPWPGLAPPDRACGHRDDEPFERTAFAGFRRRELIAPDDPRHDFNMSLLAFDAGVGLPQIEIHDEEHGLYMTAGAGGYLLDDERHTVEAGDFIYMAPYCPQGFTAGAAGAEYLLYKDVYRDGFP